MTDTAAPKLKGGGLDFGLKWIIINNIQSYQRL